MSSLLRMHIPRGQRPDLEELEEVTGVEGLEDMKELMKRCWHNDSWERPTFKGKVHSCAVRSVLMGALCCRGWLGAQYGVQAAGSGSGAQEGALSPGSLCWPQCPTIRGCHTAVESLTPPVFLLQTAATRQRRFSPATSPGSCRLCVRSRMCW